MPTKFEGAKGADAFRYPPEILRELNISKARSCRWDGGVHDPQQWRAFVENMVVFGQITPAIVSSVPGQGDMLLAGTNRLNAILQINENLDYWRAFLDEKLQAVQNQLALDTGMSSGKAGELKVQLQLFSDARKRLAEPMPLKFMPAPVKSAAQADMIAFEENNQRFEMSLMDRAQFAFTKKQQGETHREIADAMKLPSATHVGYLLDLFDLTQEAQELIHCGAITESLARKMHGLSAERQAEICAAAREGKKPSELLRGANEDHRKSGERVAHSMTELRGELTTIRLDPATSEVAKFVAGWLFEWLAGNPDAPSLDAVFAAEEDLPAPPPVEVKPAKEPKPPKAPRAPKAAKPKKEPKSKPQKADKPISKSALKKKAAAERKEEARRKAEEEAESMREELEAQEPVEPESFEDIPTQEEFEDPDYSGAGDDVPEIEAAWRVHDSELEC